MTRAPRSSLPYETAKNGNKALQDLQATLAKFDCQSFGTMIDTERGMTIVQFKWRDRSVSLEASWKGYAAAWLRTHKYIMYRSNTTREKHEQRALEQAKVSVCSCLRDWVKGQIVAVECGVMSFEAAFMPHMLLGNGERLIDHVRSSKLLPAPDEQ